MQICRRRIANFAANVFIYLRFEILYLRLEILDILRFEIQISDVIFCILYYRYWISAHFRIQILDSKFWLSGFIFQILDLRFFISDFGFQKISDFRFWISDFIFHISDIFQISDLS